MLSTLTEAEVRTYVAVAATPARWLTNGDIAIASGLPLNTVKHRTRQLAERGAIVRDTRYRRHRFQLARPSAGDAMSYIRELEEGAQVLGIGSHRKVEGRVRPGVAGGRSG